jgi:hypothetical protein
VSAVYLEVEGKPTPVAQCHWIEVAPCGCVNGIMVADMRDSVITTAEQAAAFMAPNKVALKRDIENGITHRLVSRDTFDIKTQLTGVCLHKPKWGVADVTPPEGYVWGTKDSGYGRHTWVKHLTPADGTTTEDVWRCTPDLPALCGAKPKWSWKGDDEWVLRDCVPCRKCEGLVS